MRHFWLGKRRAVFLLSLLVVAAALFWLPDTASAHAKLVSSTPAAGSIVGAGLKQIVLVFSEDVSLEASSALVVGPGSVGMKDAISAVDRVDRKKIVVSVPPLVGGVYTVSWTAVTEDDNAITNGSFSFTVAGGSAAQPTSTRISVTPTATATSTIISATATATATPTPLIAQPSKVIPPTAGATRQTVLTPAANLPIPLVTVMPPAPSATTAVAVIATETKTETIGTAATTTPAPRPPATSSSSSFPLLPLLLLVLATTLLAGAITLVLTERSA